MPKFRVEVHETLAHTYEVVEAESMDDAIEVVGLMEIPPDPKSLCWDVMDVQEIKE